MATSLVQARVEEDIKEQAAEIYDRLGMDLSTAIRIFLKRSVMVGGIPFSMVLPTSEEIKDAAVSALFEASKDAKINGTSELTLDEINAEISAVRAGRR